MTTVTTPRGRTLKVEISYNGTAQCETGKLYYGILKVARWSYYDHPPTTFCEQTLINADEFIDKFGIKIEK